MSNKLMIGAVGLLLVMVGLFAARKGISKNLYLFAIILLPLTHIAIVFSSFVSVAYVVMAGFIMYVVLRRMECEGLAKIWGYELALLIFIFYLGLSLFWGEEWRETIKQFLGVMLAGGLVLALRQGSLGPSQVGTAKRCLVIIGAAIAVLGILQIMFGEQFFPIREAESSARFLSSSQIQRLQEEGMRSTRATGTFFNAGAFGVFLLMPFCICLDELLKTRKLRYFPALLLIIAGIVCTFSRATYVLAILGTTLLFGFYLPRARLWGLMLVIMLGTAIVVFMPEKYDVMIMNMFRSDAPESLRDNIRFYYWLTALRLFWISPILGQGYGNAGFSHQTDITGIDPHSSYLAILVNQGAVGLALFVLLLVTAFIAFRLVLRYDKYTLRPLFVVFLLYLISLTVDGLILTEPFIYLMPIAFLAIYSSGLAPGGFSCMADCTDQN
jgi:O-antigen ligase